MSGTWEKLEMTFHSQTSAHRAPPLDGHASIFLDRHNDGNSPEIIAVTAVICANEQDGQPV